MITFRRAWELSRLREVHTSAGQYAAGFLLAGTLAPSAWLGLAGAVAAGLFAFTYNTLMDLRSGQALEGKGRSVGALDAADLRLLQIFCWGGLLVAVAVCWVLFHRSGKAGGTPLILAYCLVGYLYSSPVFRWKHVPGLEVTANGLAHALPFLAGWLQFQPLTAPAVLYAAAFFLFTAGFYLLHCLEDEEADRKAGITNLSMRLGCRGTALAAAGASAAAAVLAAAGAVALPVLAVMVPFFAAAAWCSWRMAASRDLAVVRRLRNAGRLYGLLFFVVLLARALILRGR